MKTVLVTCPCGSRFETTANRVAGGRGRYCSRTCMYQYRQRPSGLTYRLRKANPTSFQLGHRRHPRGTASWLWKGDRVSYQELHRWVRRAKPLPAACESCGAVGVIEWANRSHQYRRDLSDWVALCRPCHRQHDSGENRGAAVRRYGAPALQGRR